MTQRNTIYQIHPVRWHSETLSFRSSKYPQIDIRIIRSTDRLFYFRKSWDDLVLKSSGATIFQSFGWIYNWWNSYEPGNAHALHIIFILYQGKLIAIAPFYIRIFSFFRLKVFHQLRLMGDGLQSNDTASTAAGGDGISDYLDIIVRDGFAGFTSEILVDYLQDFKCFFDELDFRNIPVKSFINEWLRPELEACGFCVKAGNSDLCPTVVIPGTIDSFLESLKPSMKRKLRQIQKTLESGGITEIINVNPSNRIASLQRLKQLHQTRWNALGYPGLFFDKRFEKFISAVSSEFLKNDWLWFKLLKLDDKVIAARLGYKFKGRVYDYLSGFDFRKFAAALRPGITLLYLMIRDAIHDKYRSVEFLRGSESYKFELSSVVLHNVNISAYNVKQPKYRITLFGLIKFWSKIILRMKYELAIIILQKRNYGLRNFMLHYLRFSKERTKIFMLKQKISQKYLQSDAVKGSDSTGTNRTLINNMTNPPHGISKTDFTRRTTLYNREQESVPEEKKRREMSLHDKDN
jgi:CelD/BcsL family acetyltransferase involved in cellulose biosynthesis